MQFLEGKSTYVDQQDGQLSTCVDRQDSHITGTVGPKYTLGGLDLTLYAGYSGLVFKPLFVD